MERTMKIIATIAMFFLPIPLIVLSEICTFGKLDILHFAGYFLYGLIIMLFGGFLCKLCGGLKLKEKKKIAVTKIVIFLGGLTAVLIPAVTAALSGLNLHFSFYFLPSALFWFYLGFKTNKAFSDVYTMPWLVTVVLLNIASQLYIGGLGDFAEVKSHISVGQNIMTIVTLCEVIFAIVLANQTNIIVQSSRRREIKAVIPKRLRSYNIKLVVILSLLTAGGFVFRDYIRAAVLWIIKTIGQIIDGLLRLIPSFSADVTGGDTDLSEAETMNSQGGFNNDLLIFMFLCAVAIAVILLRKKIWTLIKNFINMIFFRKRQDEDENSISDGFTDTIESISRDRTKVKRDYTLRELLRAYKHENDNSKKIRIAYRAFLKWLQSYNITVNDSDTTNIHREKGSKLCEDTALLNDVMAMYEALRYNDVKADNSMVNEMDRLIERIDV